jgi:hypothetical protein
MNAPTPREWSEAEAEPDEEVWLRDLDGTGSMHACTPHCPGAVRYIRADLGVAFV